MALVVDASAMVFALLGKSAEATALRRRLASEVCHAPHLIDAEVGNVLRRRTLRAEIAAADAEVLLHSGAALIDHRHEMSGALARAAWCLRDNASFYDALYVALAAALGATLFTADARLSRAPDLGCTTELVGAG
ncbi:MAG: type II toxin-antitoxin system VapC family toxin [Acidimicrobiales bacterium]|jgi:predicted nucleic acid-binding protein|nr:PIN domain-containing protein [Actinomycetota bacterium]